MLNIKTSKAISLTACLILSLNVTAEGQADHSNERDIIKIGHIGHNADLTTIQAYKTQDGSRFKLKYTSDTAMKDYPHLSAQQRKRLVFGSD